MILCPTLSASKGNIHINTLDFKPLLNETLILFDPQTFKSLEYRISSMDTENIKTTLVRKIPFPKNWVQYFLSLNHSVTISNKNPEFLLPRLNKINLPPIHIRFDKTNQESTFIFYDAATPISMRFHFSYKQWKSIEKKLLIYRNILNRELLNSKPNLQIIHKNTIILFQEIFPKLDSEIFAYRTVHLFSAQPPDLPLEWLPNAGTLIFHLPGNKTHSNKIRKLAVLQDPTLPYAKKEEQNIESYFPHAFKILPIENFVSDEPPLNDCNLLHISSHGEFKNGQSELTLNGNKKIIPNILPKNIKLSIFNACSVARNPQSLVVPIVKNGAHVIAPPSFLPESVASEFPIFYTFLQSKSPENFELSFEIFHAFYPEIARYYHYFKSITAFI